MKKFFLLLLLSLVAMNLFSEDEEIPINPEAEKAIIKAMQYMAKSQNSDGSFAGGGYGKNVGIHSLVLMAFMSMGNMPGEGEYGDIVAKGLDWLLVHAKPSGLIENTQMKNRAASMYGHALATLALSEIWGQTRRKDVGEHLVRAVDLIIKCQGPKGSWGYYSTNADGDTSVTVMQVFALKSAHEAGIYVPKITMEKALKVIKSRFDKKNKMYGYSGPSNNIDSNHAGSHAAGTCIMQICGEKDLMYTEEALDQVVKIQAKRKKYDAYFAYYGSVCSYYAGKEHYKKWREIMEPVIIKRQSSNGEIGDMLGTAWGVLSLSLPYRYIPVYQREEK